MKGGAKTGAEVIDRYGGTGMKRQKKIFIRSSDPRKLLNPLISNIVKRFCLTLLKDETKMLTVGYSIDIHRTDSGF